MTPAETHVERQRARLLELMRTLSFERKAVTLSSGKSSDFYVDSKQSVLTAEGHFLMKFGSSGSRDGQFNRPTSVAVDRAGIIYVSDWGNERVQIFDPDGNFITRLTGDATVSRWAKEKLDSNPDMWRAREVAHFLEREKLFQGPIAVEVDDQDRIFVVDCARSRIQVYQKISPYFLGEYDNGRL